MCMAMTGLANLLLLSPSELCRSKAHHIKPLRNIGQHPKEVLLPSKALWMHIGYATV